jgi:pimeloyl-ACP methyl ester carboxylesterase
MRPVSTLLVACLVAGALAGCMSAPVPMTYVEHPNTTGKAKCLFVFLPGMGDDAKAFADRGFVDALRKRNLSVDMRATDATFGYYMKGTFADRLAADVIGPAKAKGYEEIWLVGPSMGGFGSLFYARGHVEEITGVLALAPFLGDRDVIEEITAAGGLKNWKAPARPDVVDRDNYQRELWRWLQQATQGREPAPLLFAGYGTEDSLAAADGLLTRELPASRVFLKPGGHTWPVWSQILDSFLDSPDFATHCR